jgi:hypothetical protein
MSVIELQILKPGLVEPAHNTIFKPSSSHDPYEIEEVEVKLTGKTVLNYASPLFYKWYSSLNIQLKPNLPNFALSKDLDFEESLAVGSHIITFTARDQEKDDLASLNAVQDAGMTGGPPKQGVPHPCVIHVFIATMLYPEATTPTLNRADVVLKAKAPILWGREIDDTKTYEPNPEYHDLSVNRIRYRWKLSPSFTPGPPPWDETPESMVFEPKDSSLTYQADLKDHLGTGNYKLTLIVEDKQTGNILDETSRNIVIV